MLIQSHLAMAQLHRLGLSKAAYDVLSAMAEVQHPGGGVNVSQAELAAAVGLSKNRTTIRRNPRFSSGTGRTRQRHRDRQDQPRWLQADS